MTKLSNFIVRVLEMNNMEDESPYKALDVREEIRLGLLEILKSQQDGLTKGLLKLLFYAQPLIDI